MPAKNPKSDYWKLVETGYKKCEVEDVATINDWYKVYLCLMRYYGKAPWDSMTPTGRAILEHFVYSEWMSTVYEQVFIALRNAWKLTTPRYRPAYEEVLKYVVENIEDVVGAYVLHPSKAYREIAEDLKISWRTVRDAFWTFRASGILEEMRERAIA